MILRNTLILSLLLVVIGAGLTMAQSTQEQRAERDAGDDAPAFEERYGLLLQNNIFRRDRRPSRTEQAPTSRPYVPPPPPQRDWVLVGIVFEDGTFRAYLENRRNGIIARVVPGDELATGTVNNVFIDAIGYEHDGQTTWVVVGQDLTGETPTSSSGTPSSRNEADANLADRDRREDDVRRDSRDSRDSGDRSNGGGSSGTEGMSIEERMRLRRQQETGRSN